MGKILGEASATRNDVFVDNVGKSIRTRDREIARKESLKEMLLVKYERYLAVTSPITRERRRGGRGEGREEGKRDEAVV